jgi:hypothetical protein
MLPYTARTPRFLHLVCLVPTIGLTLLFSDLVFVPSDGLLDGETKEQIDGFGRLIFGFFVFVGVFLSGVFLYRFIKNPWYFHMDEEGFEYAPGGVSLGRIKWSDVERLDYTTVKQGGAISPKQLRVLGVYLKDPAGYIAERPLALHALFEARRFDSGTPLVFQAGEFGSRHDQVVAQMRECLARAQKRT